MAYVKIYDTCVIERRVTRFRRSDRDDFDIDETYRCPDVPGLPQPLLPGLRSLNIGMKCVGCHTRMLTTSSCPDEGDPVITVVAWFSSPQKVVVSWKICLLAQDGSVMFSSVAEAFEMGMEVERFHYPDDAYEYYGCGDLGLDALRNAQHSDGSYKLSVDLTFRIPDAVLQDHPTARFLKSMRDNETFPDFTITVNGANFGVHRCVLGAKSSVFAAMFEHAMTEKSQSGATLDDTNPEAFKAFLGAIYGNVFDFLKHQQTTQDVLYLADKYAVDDIRMSCDVALSAFVDQSSALAILTELAAFCEAKETKAACMEALCDVAFLESEKWICFEENHSLIASGIVAELTVLRDAKAANQKRIRAKEASRGRARYRQQRKAAVKEYRKRGPGRQFREKREAFERRLSFYNLMRRK